MMRRAEPEECARLAAIHAQSFDSGWSAAAFADLLAQAYNHIYVIEQNREITAFVVLSVVAGEAEIVTLATDPAFRGRGLAQRLLEQAFDVGDAQTVFLEVAVDNAAAIRLYERLGFERAGVRRGYYARSGGVRVDALILRLALPRAKF